MLYMETNINQEDTDIEYVLFRFMDILIYNKQGEFVGDDEEMDIIKERLSSLYDRDYTSLMSFIDEL